MNAKDYFAQLLAWGWDRQRAQESVRRWFSSDDAHSAFKSVR